jgi:hypothetical protein
MKSGKIALLIALFSLNLFAVPTNISVVTTGQAAAAFADVTGDTVNGNQIRNNNGDLVLLLRNSHGTDSVTVTIDAPSTSYSIPGYGTLTRSDISVSLAAGEMKHVGVLNSTWNDANGYVQLTYTGTGTPKVTAIRSPKP